MGGERVNGWEKGRGEMEKVGLNRVGVQWGGSGSSRSEWVGSE